MAEKEDDVDIDKIFYDATKYYREVKDKLKINRQGHLDLYGYYKQVVEGKCNTIRPGFFSFHARSKWDAWNKLGDMPQIGAKTKYIYIISVVAPNWVDELHEIEEAESRHGVKENS